MSVDLSADVTTWLLVFCRVGAIMMMLPGMGDDAIPSRIKLVMGLMLALAIAPVVGAKFPTEASGDLHLGSMIVSEILVGLIYGALIKIMFSAVMVAGVIISTQTGLAMAAVFDPSMGGQNPVLGRMLTMAAIVLIFSMNVHHLFIAGMVKSYSIFQPGAGINFGDLSNLAVQTVGRAFAIGVQLSAPFLLYGFIFNAGLGFVSRLTPTIQVFFVAQPLNMMLSFGLLMVLAGTMLSVFMTYFADSVQTLLG